MGFSIALSALIFWGKDHGHQHPTLFFGLILGLAGVYVIGFFTVGISTWRKRAALPRRQGEMIQPAWEYRSHWSLLGLPLIHIRVGGDSSSNRKPVKAWIAAGSYAFGGLFAFGGVAIAPLSIGGLAVGIFPWGGMALGVVALGGFSIGGWAYGGLALGWQAYGACAIAWNAASGAAALAHGYASGVIAHAAQTGNPTVENYLASQTFFQAAQGFSRYANWLNIVWAAPLILWWRTAARAQRRQGLA